MAQIAKNILTLKAEEALNYFLTSKQYHGFELPEYFEFDNVLRNVKETIADKSYEECLTDINPNDLPDVNMDILLNKDGHYAVRPLILANPYLYYFLAREICNPSGWEAVQKCFKAYDVTHLTSCALPILPDNVESFHRSTTIMH